MSRGHVLLAGALAAAAMLASAPALAFPTGITGRSGNPAPSAGSGATCAECHTESSYDYNVGTITGPTEVDLSTSNAFTLNFNSAGGITAARAGFNLSATGGTLVDPNTSDSTVIKSGAELTHGAPRVPSAGNFTWSFNWTAPAVAGSYTFYFCNNPVNNDRTSNGDGLVRCGSAVVTVTPPPPAPPVANDDSYGIKVNTPRTVAAPGVLANDTDVNGDTLTAVLGTGPANGNLSLEADGGFTYTPDVDFTGTDTFTYQANDGAESSGFATVTLTVAPNNAPVAANDAYSATRNTQRVVAAPGVLANDSDADGDALTATVVANPSNGTLTLAAGGGFTYTPAADFTGMDTFTYQASDGIEMSNVATVTITVSDPPAAGGGGGGGGAPGSGLLAGLLAVAALRRKMGTGPLFAQN